MKFKLLLFSLLMVLAFSSCRKKIAPITSSVTDSSYIKKDSTHIQEKLVPVIVPGQTVVQKLTTVQIDSLKALFAAGKIERYYTTTDTKGLTKLQHQIDLLTGELNTRCSTADTMLYNKEVSIYILKKELEKTKKSRQEVKQVGVEKKLSIWQKRFIELGQFFLILIAAGLLSFGVYIWAKR